LVMVMACEGDVIPVLILPKSRDKGETDIFGDREMVWVVLLPISS